MHWVSMISPAFDEQYAADAGSARNPASDDDRHDRAPGAIRCGKRRPADAGTRPSGSWQAPGSSARASARATLPPAPAPALIDERVEPAEALQAGIDRPCALGRLGLTSACTAKPPTAAATSSNGSRRRPATHTVPAVRRHPARDRGTDPGTAAGDRGRTDAISRAGTARRATRGTTCRRCCTRARSSATSPTGRSARTARRGRRARTRGSPRPGGTAGSAARRRRRPPGSTARSASWSGPSMSARDGVAMKPPPPISCSSSLTRGSHFGISPRSARNGRSSGVITPPASSDRSGLGGDDRRARELAHRPDLAELLLDVVEPRDPGGGRDQVPETRTRSTASRRRA